MNDAEAMCFQNKNTITVGLLNVGDDHYDCTHILTRYFGLSWFRFQLQSDFHPQSVLSMAVTSFLCSSV